jgi:UDP-N-acetylmuramoyl-tripeptide--D-alanyl-D-alanine ligase
MNASFEANELLQATGGTVRGTLPERVSSVSTDSRAIESGALFVALQGERFDGHDFLEKAASAGAAAAVVRRGACARAPERVALIEVDDTLVALGQLARLHRRRFSIPVGAITGSNGKTTVKEMIGTILSVRGPTLKTEGNLNNEVGVPLTLLKLDASHSSAIIEMGMNHPGELTRLSAIGEPCCAEVTCIAPAHLAGLGDIEAVARAKGEIYAGLPAEGLALANADDPRVLAQARASGRRVVTFGKAEGSDVRLREVVSHDASGLKIRVGWQGKSYSCTLRFVGEHNAVNACGAFAMGLALGCSPSECVEGLLYAKPWAHRLALVEVPGEVTVLDDCYNANPASMAAALATQAALAKGRRRVAVLGDMLELGNGEEALHREVGKLAVDSGVEVLVGLGPRSKAMIDAASSLGEDAFCAPDPEGLEGALDFLIPRLRPSDLVLIKASRGMRLERMVEALAGRKV